jgi:hypothetical protein
MPPSGYVFILRFTKGTTVIERWLEGVTSITVPLERGKWKLDVNGYADSGQGLTFKT